MANAALCAGGDLYHTEDSRHGLWKDFIFRGDRDIFPVLNMQLETQYFLDRFDRILIYICCLAVK